MNRSRSLLLSSMLLSATLTACVFDEEVGDMPDGDPPVSECMTDEQCDDGERCVEGACVADCVCPAVDEPICGVDGVTYGNRCQAECVGVEVAEAGECRDVPGECAPGDCGDPPDVAACPDGEGPRLACERNADGACGWQIGECADVCACPENYDPVCGADGQTYGNACEARCAQVEVIAEGECRDEPRECRPVDCGPGPRVEPCADGNAPPQECRADDANICTWFVGECPEPCACPDVYDPVCGADGETYGNACEARCAQVEVVAEGECGEPGECREADCGPPPFLVPLCPDGIPPPVECVRNDDGMCGWEIGACEDEPGECREDECGPAPFLLPVCPDGSPPPQACVRNDAGMCGWQIGECPGECADDDCGPRPARLPDCPGGGPPPMACQPNDAGVCGWQVFECPGECNCLQVWDPVCGVDGQTYGNACEAGCAGVRIAYEGECRGEPAECAEDECGPQRFLVAPCPDGSPPVQICVRDDAGMCGWQIGECPGECACDLVWDPVCGADGQTYGNACEARCAGIQIDYAGECRGEPAECQPAECGPAPGAPNFECPDGSLGGPVCERAADGVCGWNFRQCPEDCLCPQVWAPVCGVDGMTYGNACEARCAGIQVAHEGECGEVGMCDPDACGPQPFLIAVLCPDGDLPGQACVLGADGVCRWQMGECPDPECGRDACGPPPPVAACPDGNGPSVECLPQDDGACGWVVGQCEDGCLCPQVWEPVCGADGVTYGNACEADCAGAEVVARGECPIMACVEEACGPPPFLIAPCPDGGVPPQECVPGPDGACRWQIGECPPFECAPDACGPPPPQVPCDDGIGPSLDCVPRGDGVCGWEIGQCEEPCICPDVWAPVCGADGNTYGNACEARCARVEVVAEGECRVDACGLPADSGPCEAAMRRYYHNAATGQCEMFVYGGCGGNANNFETEEACVDACGGGNAGECAADECGVAPGAPNVMCDDGSVGGPICERADDGVCGWNFRECPPANECGPDACGPAPRPLPCDDGRAPTQECVPSADGRCGWLTECRAGDDAP